MPELEFHTGCLYETRERRKVICVFDNLPGILPILMIGLECDGNNLTFCRQYRENGKIWSSVDDKDDIVAQLPNEPDYELIAKQRILLDRIKEINQTMKIIKNMDKEEPKLKKGWLYKFFNWSTNK